MTVHILYRRYIPSLSHLFSPFSVTLVRRTCFPMSAFRRYPHTYGIAKFSPKEVSVILRQNESSIEVDGTSVKAFDTNQLPSNSPIEDRLSVARCRHTPGMLFGIYDGHGGGDVAEMSSQCLFDYIVLSLMPLNLVKEHAESDMPFHDTYSHPLRQPMSEKTQKIHKANLKNYSELLLSDTNSPFNMKQALTRAFLQFDDDMSRHAELTGHIDPEALSLAVSGSCACIAHIDGSHLHFANCGDCQAILGVQVDTNKWTFKPLGSIHDADNVQELKRIMSEHPKSEINTVIKNQRLLGQLAPLRAFGDFQYKWEHSLMENLLVPAFGSFVFPPSYHTPPYLTALPEVVHHQLTPRDKFLVIATDGLWEQMMPHKVVKYIGEHMSGKQTLDHLRLPRKQMLLEEVNDILSHRRIGLSKKVTDINSATYLMRNALGRTESGIEHSKLSAMLSFPEDMVRNFRDDISIIVVYFDSELLRHHPD